MTPRLCVTVTAATTAELRRRRDAVRDADLVELRIDSVSDPDVAGALRDRRRPVIVKFADNTPGTPSVATPSRMRRHGSPFQ